MDKYCIGKDLLATGAVTLDEAFLSYLTVHGNGNVVVKNGGAEGVVVFRAENTTGNSQHFTFPYPIKIRNGMYIELSLNVTATIGYFG